MQSDIIYSIYFGLGVLLQAYFFIRQGFKKEDIKELIKDIGGGVLFVFIVLVAIGRSEEKINLPEVSLAMIYTFFAGFGAALTMSFRKRILPQMNQVSLLILNTIFLYYITTRLGYANFFAIFFYIPTLIGLLLILFKTELKNYQKGFLCIWYLVLLIFTGFINIYYISSATKSHLYSSYLSTFLAGSVALYIYVFIVYLIAFIPISDKNEYAIARRKAEVKEHFLLLTSSFRKLNINSFLSILTLFILAVVLFLNFQYKYISENLFIAIAIFLTAYLNEKLSRPIILNANDSAAQKSVE